MEHIIKKLGSHLPESNPAMRSIIINRDMLFDKYISVLNNLEHWYQEYNDTKGWHAKHRKRKVIETLTEHLKTISNELVGLDNRMMKYASPKKVEDSPIFEA